jgi:hypothetical protein
VEIIPIQDMAEERRRGLKRFSVRLLQKVISVSDSDGRRIVEKGYVYYDR